MVCQECGVNTEIVGGHSRVCSQYEEPRLSTEQFNALHGIDPELSARMRSFGDAINDAVIDRGEKTLLSFLASIGMTEDDPGYAELKTLGHICLSVGAGITVQIMIEQDILDQAGLRRAAGI